MNLNSVKYLVTQSFKEWSDDNASRLAASLAYYTIFSIPPLLIIAIAIAAQLFDRTAVQQQLVGQITDLVGSSGAEVVQTALENSDSVGGTVFATVVSVVTLLFGASGVFGALHSALNSIWEVKPKPGRGILGTLKDRFLSFTMVLGVGFLLLVSLVLSSVLAAFSDFVNNALPSLVILAQVINFVVSFGVVTVLFALIYKIVPDVQIAWRDVWVGALMTALLFTIGKFAIGLYLGNSAPGSTYGAAGSLIVLLLWVYYSAQILFLGAEFTQVYANKFGSRIVADEDAIGLSPQARRAPAGSGAADRSVYKPSEDAKTAVFTQPAISRPIAPAPVPVVPEPTPAPALQTAEAWAKNAHRHVVQVLAIGLAGWQFASKYLFKQQATQS